MNQQCIIKSLAALGLAIFSLYSSAAPFLVHKNGASIYDQETGLIWMRCSLGQTWDGRVCNGEAKQHTFEDAQQAANAFSSIGDSFTWTLPTARQLLSLRECSNGVNAVRDLRDGGKPVFESCISGGRVPTILQKSLLSMQRQHYWSASSDTNYITSAWSVDFSSGTVVNVMRTNDLLVRLVRANPLSSEEIVRDYLQITQDMVEVFEKVTRIELGMFRGSNNLTWRKCSIGRSYDPSKNTCTGEADKAEWLNMIELASKDTYGGFNDWRIPTEVELDSVVGRYSKCDPLKQRVNNLFPSISSNTYFQSHHWLLDNSAEMTNPSSADLEVVTNRYTGCKLLTKDLRPHARQPAILVRGGVVPEEWRIALSKTSQAQALSEQSKKAGVAMMEGINTKLERVADAFRSPSTASASNSSSAVDWTITKEENGGGLAHWYTKKYSGKCTSGRKTGELITIHLLKSTGKYQEVYGSVKNSLSEAARDACS